MRAVDGVVRFDANPVAACAHIQREPRERLVGYIRLLSSELPATGARIAAYLDQAD